MKRVLIILGIVALFASCSQNGVDKNAKLTTEIDSASYSLGLLIGSDLAQNAGEDTLVQNLIFSGLAAGLDGDSTAVFNREEATGVWRGYMEKQREKQMKKAQEEMAENKEKGAKFLSENKTKAGIITTESGLQYKIEKQGEGKLARKGDIVSVHYTGKLIDGTEFDSSVKGEKKPFEFPVGEGRVIPAWDEALQLMPVGSKWQLFIPAELAYGDRQIAAIPAGSVLIFDVELLDITSKK